MVQQISSVGIYEDKSLPGDEDERDNLLNSQHEGYPTTPLAQSFSDGEESEEAEILSEKGEGSENGLMTFNGLDMEVSALDELGFKDTERDTGPPTSLLLGSSVEIGSPVTPLPVLLVKSPDRVQRPITCVFGIPLLLCFLIGLECGTLLLVQMFLILFLAYLSLRKLMYLILASLCILYAQFEALF